MGCTITHHHYHGRNRKTSPPPSPLHRSVAKLRRQLAGRWSPSWFVRSPTAASSSSPPRHHRKSLRRRRNQIHPDDGDKRGPPPILSTVVRPPPTRATDYAHRWFVGFGVDAYVDPAWSSLRNCKRDVYAVGDALADDFGFRNIAVCTDADCTRVGVGKVLETRVAEYVGPDDLLVVMFSGHGSPSFFACHDTGADARLRVDKFTARDLDRLCRDCPARHLLVIVDSCYGGCFARFGESEAASETRTTRRRYRSSSAAPSSPRKPHHLVAADLLRTRTRLVLTSGPADQVVSDGDDGHSPFAAALLRTLAHLAAGPPSPAAGPPPGIATDLLAHLRRDAGIRSTPLLGRGPTDHGGDVLLRPTNGNNNNKHKT